MMGARDRFCHPATIESVTKTVLSRHRRMTKATKQAHNYLLLVHFDKRSSRNDKNPHSIVEATFWPSTRPAVVVSHLSLFDFVLNLHVWRRTYHYEKHRKWYRALQGPLKRKNMPQTDHCLKSHFHEESVPVISVAWTISALPKFTHGQCVWLGPFKARTHFQQRTEKSAALACCNVHDNCVLYEGILSKRHSLEDAPSNLCTTIGQQDNEQLKMHVLLAKLSKNLSWMPPCASSGASMVHANHSTCSWWHKQEIGTRTECLSSS